MKALSLQSIDKISEIYLNKAKRGGYLALYLIGKYPSYYLCRIKERLIGGQRKPERSKHFEAIPRYGLCPPSCKTPIEY